MPRSKAASREETQGTVLAAIEGLRDALLKPKAPKVLEHWLSQLGWEWHFWNGVLQLRKSLRRKEFHKRFTPKPTDIANVCQGEKPTEADLQMFSQTLKMVADAISSGHPPPSSPSYLRLTSRFLSRHAYQGKTRPRKLKQVFIQAYRRREGLKARGKVITVAALAHELTPAEYQRNPDNATRNLGRGLRRVAHEHQRCMKLGIPSVFSSEVALTCSIPPSLEEEKQ